MEKEQFDQEELRKILENLESMESDKISSTLKAAENSVELKQRLEKRYLNLIRAILKNSEAQLSDFSLAFSDNKYLSTVLNDVFYPDANKIEFVYLSNDEAETIINITGAIVSNHVSVDDYIEKAKSTSELNEIGETLFSTIDILQGGIDTEVNAYPEGWYGQLCIKIMKSMIFGIRELVVLKSWLAKANRSVYIKEFNFFLCAASTEDFIIAEMRDIMDEGFNFSEVLWLFAKTPTIFYPLNYNYHFPKSPLKYGRTFQVVKFEEFYNEAGDPDLKRLIDKHGIEEINSVNL